MVLAAGLVVALRPDLGNLRALPQYLTFTQEIQLYWSQRSPNLAYWLIPTWSLAVEEQFYILWPVLLGLAGPRRLPMIAAVCIVAAPAARHAGFSPTLLLTRFDGFAIGGLLAAALAWHRSRDGGDRLFTALAAAIGAGCLLVFLIVPPLLGAGPFDLDATPLTALRQTLSCLLFASIVGLTACHAGHPILAPLRARWLCYLGTISYGIYLYHLATLLVADAVTRRLRLPAPMAPILIGPALTLAVSAASWSWIERPCLRLKDRFSYGPPRAETPIEPDADVPDRLAMDGPRDGVGPRRGVGPAGRPGLAPDDPGGV